MKGPQFKQYSEGALYIQKGLKFMLPSGASNRCVPPVSRDYAHALHKLRSAHRLFELERKHLQRAFTLKQ